MTHGIHGFFRLFPADPELFSSRQCLSTIRRSRIARLYSYHFDTTFVDNCKGSMANEVFGIVLVDSNGVHHFQYEFLVVRLWNVVSFKFLLVLLLLMAQNSMKHQLTCSRKLIIFGEIIQRRFTEVFFKRLWSSQLFTNS